MRTPKITIDLRKIEHNTRIIYQMCSKHNIALAGVTKGTLGMPEVAEAMIRGGATYLAESRLANIERLKLNGIKVPIILIRSPYLSEIDRVVELADISFNTEFEVIKALSEASIQKNTIHKIVIMVDLGDLREGVWPDDLYDILGKTLSLKGVKVIGLGTNLTDLNGVIPTTENNQKLVDLADEMEKAFGIKFELLTAANSSSIKLLKDGGIPKGINHFRIGEGILLGCETIAREKITDTYQDAFVLTGEIIEKKWKPSTPIGELGQDAFGNTPVIEDKGMMLRGILNIGRQDVNIAGLKPQDKNISIIGACSDHLILDITKADYLEVGDMVSFELEYSALLAAMTSPFVAKAFVPADKSGNMDGQCHYITETFDTNDLQVRNATEADIDVLVGICNRWTDKCLLEGEPFEPDYIQRSIQFGDLPPIENAHKDNFRFKVVCLKSDGTIIGFFDLYHGYSRGDMLWISMFLIDAGYQKQGVGRQVIDALSSDGKQKGYNSIGIGVHLKNWKGLKFWQRNGFDKIMGIYGDMTYAPDNFALIGLEKKL